MIMGITDFTRLYKKSSQGKIEEWHVRVINQDGVGLIKVSYGENGGAKTTKVTKVSKGKNIGKSNETSPYEQARAEAQSKFDKQIRKGYVTSMTMAVAGCVDDEYAGSIAPMLAKVYSKVKTKVKFPQFIQVKLNGHRCTAVKHNGEVRLWSRGRKEITTVPHVLAEVKIMMDNQPDGMFLDGELYRHGWTLQRITSAIKKHNEDTHQIEFHVYDCGLREEGYKAGFEKRLAFLVDLEWYWNLRKHVHFVRTGIASSHFEVDTAHDKFVAEGYEGAMLRSPEGVYGFDKRSDDLLKVKAFLDDEFPIIDVVAGKDKTVVFVVRLPNGTSCEVTMSGDKDENQRFLHDNSTWMNKYLTVRFKEYTPDGKLFHSTGLQVKEDI